VGKFGVTAMKGIVEEERMAKLSYAAQCAKKDGGEKSTREGGQAQ